MGTLYKRGKIWYINTIAGKRRIRKRIGTSKKLAQLALKDLDAKIIRNELNLDFEEASLLELFERFLDHSKLHHSHSTYLRYRNVIENFWIYVDLVLDDDIDKVSDLKPPHFDGYKKYRLETDPRSISVPDDYPLTIRANRLPAKPITLNYEIKTIRSIFKWGITRDLCAVNPAKNVQTLKVIDSQIPRFLTTEEIKSFLDHCNEEQYRIFFTFLNTGLRLGELLNLQWSDIDLKRKRLKVQKKTFWQPKSGERELPLNHEMAELLKNHRPKEFKTAGFVFPHKDGGRIKKKLRQDVVNIAKRAGLEDLTKVHTFRHTFASHLVMRGVDLPTVQKLMGHADIQTTMIYAHLAPGHLAGAVDKLKF